MMTWGDLVACWTLIKKKNEELPSKKTMVFFLLTSQFEEVNGTFPN